jgi:hypothetical protein
MSSFSFAQNILNKKSISQILKNSIDQPKKGKITFASNPWIINNKDSSYYKLDTIKAFNRNRKYSSINICEAVEWTFYKEDSFAFEKAHYCKEPASRNVIKLPQDLLKIKITEQYDKIYLELFDFEKKLVEKFQIISIEEKNLITVLTLVRNKKKASL